MQGHGTAGSRPDISGGDIKKGKMKSEISDVREGIATPAERKAFSLLLPVHLFILTSLVNRQRSQRH